MQTSEKDTSKLIHILLVVHLITAGIYAGGCLYLAFVDLPLFQSLTSDEYSRTAKVWLPKAGRLMLPSFLIPLITSVVLWLKATVDKRLWLGVGLCFLVVLGITVAVLIPLNNELLSDTTLTSGRLEEIRERRGLGHWIRTGVALIAFAMSVIGVSKR